MTRLRAALWALCAGFLLMLATFAAVAQATAWPQRTVRLVVPLGLGSGADIGARLFAEKLAARWGKPVVVENWPGGDTMFVTAQNGQVIDFIDVGSYSVGKTKSLHFNGFDQADAPVIAGSVDALDTVSHLKQIFSFRPPEPSSIMHSPPASKRPGMRS